MVRHITDPSGRVSEKSQFKPDELDKECQSIITAFLREVHGKSTFPVTTDDLTVLIERYVKDLDLYADLSGYGETVEGVTEFQLSGKPSVAISEELTGDSRRENRLRTTLAHEFGHVRLHGYLFALTGLEAQQAFRQTPTQGNKIICKREAITQAKAVDWMEWQANYFSSALLMPVRYVKGLVEQYKLDVSEPWILENSRQASELIQVVQQRFAVSADAARVRLSSLHHFATPDSHPQFFR
jgi:hypothetical protein